MKAAAGAGSRRITEKGGGKRKKNKKKKPIKSIDLRQKEKKKKNLELYPRCVKTTADRLMFKGIKGDLRL